jgi:hypothetical protein
MVNTSGEYMPLENSACVLASDRVTPWWRKDDLPRTNIPEYIMQIFWVLDAI